jgi:hypothetical protein
MVKSFIDKYFRKYFYRKIAALLKATLIIARNAFGNPRKIPVS